MKKSMLTFFIIGMLAGCSQSVHRGTVAMKVSETSAHICLGGDEVKVGDRVALYRNDCSSVAGLRKGFASNVTCVKRLISKGRVTEILNDHYSVASFDPGVEIKEGDVVERSDKI